MKTALNVIWILAGLTVLIFVVPAVIAAPILLVVSVVFVVSVVRGYRGAAVLLPILLAFSSIACGPSAEEKLAAKQLELIEAAEAAAAEAALEVPLKKTFTAIRTSGTVFEVFAIDDGRYPVDEIYADFGAVDEDGRIIGEGDSIGFTLGVSNIAVRDGFGKLLRYRFDADGKGYEIRSSGPDGEFGTEDDLFRLVGPNGVEEKGLDR